MTIFAYIGFAILIFSLGYSAGQSLSGKGFNVPTQSLGCISATLAIPTYFLSQYLLKNSDQLTVAIVGTIGVFYGLCLGFSASDIRDINRGEGSRASITRQRNFWSIMYYILMLNFIAFIFVSYFYIGGYIFGGKIDGDKYFLYNTQDGLVEVTKNVYNGSKFWAYTTVGLGLLTLWTVLMNNKLKQL